MPLISDTLRRFADMLDKDFNANKWEVAKGLSRIAYEMILNHGEKEINQS